MIGACLDSVAWADERLVVLDAATRDATRSVAEAHGARVVERTFDTFAAQRDFALAQVETDWVLFVDADERVPAELRDEIRRTVAREGAATGYWISRHNVIVGRVVRHAGWYPDYQLRLLRRGRARYDPQRPVHEVPLLDGPDSHLGSPLVHFNYRTLAEFVRKQERYCRLEADRLLIAHGRPRARAVVGQPLREMWRRYVALEGYREGPLGLALCLILAWYAGKAAWLARRRGGPTRAANW